MRRVIYGIFFSSLFFLSASRIHSVVAQQDLKITQVAVGNYTPDGGHIFPSIITSLDGGEQWSYTMTNKQFTPPHNSGRSALLKSVSCSDNSTCVAVGDYATNSGRFPMVVVSHDSGITWTYKVTDTLLLPPHSAANPNADLSSVSCSEQVCVVTGTYYNNAGMIYPILMVSQNSGDDWEYKMYDTLLPPPHAAQNPNVHIMRVSCDHKLCTATGDYFNYAGFFPMVVVSTDGGDTWEYKVFDSQLPPPHITGDPHARLRSVSCSGNVCATVGDYTNGTGYFPMLIVSIDGGKSWKYKMSDTLLPPPEAKDNPAVGFRGVSCNQKTCVAVGDYNDQNGRFPMVVTSVDKGRTWKYKVTHIQPVPHSGTDPNTQMNTVDCSSQLCVIGGSYRNGNGDGTGMFPFILVSKNQGENWDYKIFDTYQYPPHIGVDPMGVFRSVSCKEDQCIAVGDYKHQSSFNTFPMLAISSDYGNTWSYKVDDTHHLPPHENLEDFDGMFVGANQ